MKTVDDLIKIKAEDDEIYKFVIEGAYRWTYVLMPPKCDLANALEYTLHACLDNEWNEDDIYAVMGLVRTRRPFAEDDYVFYVDLDYVCYGAITLLEKYGEES